MASKRRPGWLPKPGKTNLFVYVILKSDHNTNYRLQFKEKVEKVLLNAEAQQDKGCSILIIPWSE